VLIYLVRLPTGRVAERVIESRYKLAELQAFHIAVLGIHWAKLAEPITEVRAGTKPWFQPASFLQFLCFHSPHVLYDRDEMKLNHTSTVSLKGFLRVVCGDAIDPPPSKLWLFWKKWSS